MNPSNEYCLYLRKSRSDGSDQSVEEVLARHEATLMALAQKLGLPITGRYAEVVSGESIVSRPEIQRLLSDVEQGRWAGVLVVEVERLARGDTIDQGLVAQAFRLSGTKIITPLKTYDPDNEFDEEYFEFGLFMSRREYKTINRRLQRGRVLSVQEGKYIGSRAPYGYNRAKLEGEKGWTLTPHPEQFAVVQMIGEWYGRGVEMPDGRREIGPTLIAKRLNSMGIRTQTNSEWSASSVYTILINPLYGGWLRWGSRPTRKVSAGGKVQVTRPRAKDATLARGKFTPAWEEELFERIQEKLRSHAQIPLPSARTMQNPFAGLLYCGQCGKAMIRRPYPGNKAPSVICTTLGCSTVGANLDEVEEHVLRMLESWLKDCQLTLHVKRPEKRGEKADVIRKLEQEIKNIDQQLEKAYDLVEQGIYTTQVFLERSTRLTERRKQVEGQLADEQEARRAADERERMRYEIVPQLKSVLATYAKAQTAQEKNDLLKTVLERIVYTKTTRVRSKAGSDLSIVLYPRLKY